MATPPFIGSATAAKAGATSGDTTITLSSGLTGGSRSSVQTGDLVIAVFATGSTADRTLSITDGTNPYTLIGSELYANAAWDTNLRVAYKFMGGTPDTTVTFGPTGNTADAGAMAVYVFSGVDSTTTLDVAVTTASGSSSVVDPPSITPVTTDAEIVVIAAAAYGFTAAAFTSSDLSSFVSLSSSGTNICTLGLGRHDWTSGAFNPAAFGGKGADSGLSWVAMSLALRPAPVVASGNFLQFFVP